MADTRPTDGTCSRWVGDRYCRAVEGVRRFQPGWRCPEHDLRVLAGLPPLPDSPGIRAYRRGAEG